MKTKETLTLRIPAGRKASLLKLLKELPFVEIETTEEKLKRYSKNAPKKTTVSEKDIIDEVLAVRYGKSQK